MWKKVENRETDKTRMEETGRKRKKEENKKHRREDSNSKNSGKKRRRVRERRGLDRIESDRRNGSKVVP